ncbi:MAG TPA: translocation/assembly module TamB domain-containing protein, partial [Vicinamibacterales bacterium]
NSEYTVTVPELTFADAKVQATTGATFVKAGGIELNSLKATTTYEQKQLAFTTNLKEKTRELDASGDVVLHTDHQEIHLPQLAVRTQGVEWKTAPGSAATVQYGSDRIDLKDVKLVSGDQSLEVSGAIATGDAAKGPNAESNAIDVHARNVDLQQLQTLALMDRGLSGKLNADARITGTTGAPVVDGKIQIDNGGFQTYHYDSFTANLEYNGTRVGIDATLQQSPTEAITAKGSVPTSLFKKTEGTGHVPAAGADDVDLHIKSTALNLAVIQGVTTQVTNVTGTLEADVRVTGSGEDPHLNGFIDIKGGGFGVPAVGETYSGLSTRIDLQPDALKIQRFDILDRHGEKLSIDGQLAVHERRAGAVTINVNSDNFELVNNELGDVQVQSAIKITGEVRRPRIVGNVRLDAGRIEVDKLLQLFYDPYATTSLPDVVSAERKVEGSGSAEEATKQALASAQQSAAAPGTTPEDAEPPAPPSAMDPVAMDLHVVIPDNLVLRGHDIRPGGPTGTALGDMNITVGGDIHARKDPGGKIALVGTVNTVRGTYEFQGRRFDLQRDGTLRFIGTTQINPLIDVTATRLIPNTGVTAKVHITGTTTAPQLTLTSDPPLEESDILSLIVFNRQVNELGTGERSSLAATAGGIATGFIAAPLGESIGKALDLDLFEITTSTENGGLGAGITLGQQIGDRAFVKLRQEFGERSTTEFL